MTKTAVQSLLQQVKDGSLSSWDEVHAFYRKKGEEYAKEKWLHAYASLLQLLQLKAGDLTASLFGRLLDESVQTKEWLTQTIYESRQKDYQNEFRKMVYENDEEMDAVLGRLEDNMFVKQQKEELERFRTEVQEIKQRFAL